MPYRSVVLGGTFDRIHKGHEALLSKAFEVGSHVWIGLTTDAYVARYKPGKHIRPYKDRKRDLITWLGDNKPQGRVTIVPLEDRFGPVSALSDSKEDFDAIVVSRQTRANAERNNQDRVERGRKPLIVIEIPMVLGENGLPISSTQIRSGTIDRDGNLVLPVGLRDSLKQPLGEVLPDSDIPGALEKRKGTPAIAVGDRSTEVLLSHGITPTLSVIDFQVERKPYGNLKAFVGSMAGHTTKLTSGPGFISHEVLSWLETWLKKWEIEPHVLVIGGEEDLLTLPVILFAPVGCAVYYGQPPTSLWACGPLKSGLVKVVVTEEKKKEVSALLTQFTGS